MAISTVLCYMQCGKNKHLLNKITRIHDIAFIVGNDIFFDKHAFSIYKTVLTTCAVAAFMAETWDTTFSLFELYWVSFHFCEVTSPNEERFALFGKSSMADESDR